MVLNTKKTKAMVFDFSNSYQFSTRIKMDNETINIILESKLLTWDSNTKSLVKRENARKRFLHKLVEFNVPREDLTTVYVLYIRSILEQRCQVWHSKMTLKNVTGLELVQKNALKSVL